MKTFQVIAILCTALSVASAADLETKAVVVASPAKNDAVALIPTETRKLQDGKSWDNGTKVYKEFPNEGWWSGTITSFSQATGMYTITWEDGSTDYYDDSTEVDQMVAWAQADPQNNPAGATDVSGAYPAGTPVSVFEDGDWYDGIVIKYGSNTYTIQWDEDDEIEEVAAGPIMDQMVMDADGDDDAPPDDYEASATSAPSDGASEDASVEVGADVSYYDDEDEEWVDGTITAYKNNVYTVTWEDGETDQYDDNGEDLDELTQAVFDAYGDDDDWGDDDYQPVSGPKYPVGTPVSDFEDEQWIMGEVVDFQDGSYIVQWDDEDDVEYYDSHNAEDMQELKKMSKWANGDDDAPPDEFFEDEDLWLIGTPVAIQEDDKLWYGEIDGWNSGAYSVSWDNGEQEWLDNEDLVNQMVANAVENPKGMSGAGKFFLSLFVISVCGVGSVYGYKYYQKYQTEKKFSREVEAEDGGFRDRPDNLPKII